jgi:hypothetical protein
VTAPTSPNPQPSPQSPLSLQEIKLRQKALEEINIQINGPLSKAIADIMALENVRNRQLIEASPIVQIAKLEMLRDSYSTAYADLERLLRKYSEFDDIINMTNWNPGPVNEAFFGYISTLQLLPDTPMQSVSGIMIHSSTKAFDAATLILSAWIKNIKQTIAAKQAEYDKAELHAEEHK